MLGRALQLGLPLQHDYFGNPQDLEPLYFGAMYAASAGWYGLAARDRRKRFRLMPIGLDGPAGRRAHAALAVRAARRHRRGRAHRHARSRLSVPGASTPRATRSMSALLKSRTARSRPPERRHWFFLWHWTPGVDRNGSGWNMKRLLLLVLLVMMVAWFATTRDVRVRNRPALFRPTHCATSGCRSSPARRGSGRAQEAAEPARAHRAMAEARGEVRRGAGRGRPRASRRPARGRRGAREAVDGIPVPILSGTRVVEAVPQPPAPPALPSVLWPTPLFTRASARSTGALQRPGLSRADRASAGSATFAAGPCPTPTATTDSASPKRSRSLTGLISATEERAKEEARKQLEKEVTDWLEPSGVPRSWKPSPRQIDAMILETTVEPVVKDYGTLYEAKLRVDVSPERRACFTESYQRQLVHRRMVLLGGTLASS